MDIFYSALLARFPFHFRLYMSSRAAPIFCSLLSTFILVTDEGSKLEILGLLAAISTLLLGYIHANESIALALNRSSTPSQRGKMFKSWEYLTEPCEGQTITLCRTGKCRNVAPPLVDANSAESARRSAQADVMAG